MDNFPSATRQTLIFPIGQPDKSAFNTNKRCEEPLSVTRSPTLTTHSPTSGEITQTPFVSIMQIQSSPGQFAQCSLTAAPQESNIPTHKHMSHFIPDPDN